jgi:acetylglutamate kinase
LRVTDAPEVAAESVAAKPIFPTDVDGTHDGSTKPMPRLNIAMAEDLPASGAASGGMVAEIEARALEL